MLHRVDSLYDWFDIPESQRTRAMQIAREAAVRASTMMHVNDYHALAAVTLATRPASIFEIGTYRGVTSDFFLSLLPDVKLVSIAYFAGRTRGYTNRARNLLVRILEAAGTSFSMYNHNALTPREIGHAVASENRPRFTQLIGDSHDLVAAEMISRFRRFDLVFIDGDHSTRGVVLDTRLAALLISANGTICWHDANPKPGAIYVRRYLERKLPYTAVATRDDYHGGIACWSRHIEQRIARELIPA